MLEQTIGAIASCLFKVLHPLVNSDVLGPAIEIIRKALEQGSVSIERELCEGAATFVNQTTKSPWTKGGGRRRAANQNDKENGSEEKKAELEKFLNELILALLSHKGQSAGSDSGGSGSGSALGSGLGSSLGAGSESLRKSRVGLAHALVESFAVNAQSRGNLASILDGWLQSERSRPLREEIEKVRAMLD
jgi:hypothetical protein